MEHTCSPKQFGALSGTSVLTLQHWDMADIFPAHRIPTNRCYYTHDQCLEYRGLTATGAGITIVSARVSSTSQKLNLQDHVPALRDYCLRRHVKADEWREEVSSGLNSHRTHVNRIMHEIERGRVQPLSIAHTDRLVRLGCEWFTALCERHGMDLVVATGESVSPEYEFVHDFLSSVHVFSARLSGLRSSQKVIRDATVQKNAPPGQ
jgi:putative resolvase